MTGRSISTALCRLNACRTNLPIDFGPPRKAWFPLTLAPPPSIRLHWHQEPQLKSGDKQISGAQNLNKEREIC